ncbi:MAG TPA: helix-turn-helix transcriptional regulator [Rhizomicrobium sp.]|jgi:transcriptional regulator with XRE-family HTH domain|nr:helix-turn-helix transcriptional regulator [Rhizomicrobium sp.]
MITGRQIRAARSLLDWTAEALAKQAGLSREAIQKIESGAVQPRSSNLAAILDVLDAHGIEFNGERGVAFKDDQVVTLKGENIFFRLLDDVIATLKGHPKPEALFACVDDRKSPPAVIENYRNLRHAGIAMRSLVKEGNSFLMGRLTEYRYLPARHFHNNATVIYGDKFATMILDANGKDVGAIIIHNPHIAAAQRNLFNLVWSNATKPTKSTAEVRYDE